MRAYFTRKFKAKEDYVFFYGAIIAYKGELVGRGGDIALLKISYIDCPYVTFMPGIYTLYTVILQYY